MVVTEGELRGEKFPGIDTYFSFLHRDNICCSPRELLAADSLPEGKALHIGRMTQLHYLSFGAEEGSISGTSRQNYLFMLVKAARALVS
jgi:hypothetical protein